jgi:ketosteroid isomerase-like protein
MRSLRLVTLVAAFLAVALETAPAQTPSSSPQQISSVREEWVKDWNAKQLSALLMLYTQDAVLLPPTGQRITGRDAIGAYLKPVMDSRAGNLSVTSVSADAPGTLGYDSGTYRDAIKGGTVLGGNAQIGGNARISGGGGERNVEGNYLTILMRQRDGKWLIVQQAFSEVPAK